jgi:SlyX protein
MTDSLELLTGRIEELESQLAFQDELIESLNTTVAKQDAEVLELKRHFSMLSDRIKDIGDASAGGQTQHEIPPHY